MRQLGQRGRPTLLRLAARVRSQHCWPWQRALDRWMVGSNLLQMKWAQELKWAEWRSKEVWRADMCSQVCCKCLTTDIEYWFHAVAPASSGLPLLCVLDPKQDSPSNRRPTPTQKPTAQPLQLGGSRAPCSYMAAQWPSKLLQNGSTWKQKEKLRYTVHA
jgi:hypothetical protein